ncbi:glycosyltransferase family 39 protein [Streptomyces malaysiensis]|uniref:glycosyltransferase family 39 protein n=1 Tax=Streptomyces malaysiensis TaxID=92644 RepID=UPI001E355FF8|nr:MULTISPECIES: glycosyltransferase family 39 protein [unclassified Streptomyces]
MAVMLWLGLWGLDRGTMWRDESATYQMARRTLPQIRDALGTVDAVHGLYYLLMRPVLALRPSEVTMRLPSVLAAVAATALVAALGCRLARPRVGLWAGLLYATTPVVTHYAQEGRSYALVAAGAAWATYLLVGTAGVGPRAGRADGPVPGSGPGPGGLASGADRADRADRAGGLGSGSGPSGFAPGANPATRSASGPAGTPSGLAAGADRADQRAPGSASVAGLAGRDADPGSGTQARSAVSVPCGVPRLGRAASAPGAGGHMTGWRWAAYGGVVAVTALLHVFAVLMLAAHAVTLLVSRAPRRVWWGWGSAAAGAVGVVVPLAMVARRQIAQIAWMRRPTPGRLWAVVEEFAGPSALVLAASLLLITLALVRPRWRSLTAVALPLICVPPVLLFALALHRPCFHERYLLFALPGIPLLAAAGMDRLVGVVVSRLVVGVAGHEAGGVAGRRVQGVAGRRIRVAAGGLAVGCAFVWQFPLHQLERQPLSRQDDLAALAAAVGRLTRPGEPVLYDPPKERRIAIAYPRPLAGLRDIALGTPGPASGTLYGVDVGPAELLRRLGGARSAWLIAADEPRARPVKAAALTGSFRLAYSLCLPGIRLEHYVRAGPAG